MFFLPLFSAGRWNAKGMELVARSSTTLRWTLVVSVQRLTPSSLAGTPPLPMRLPSRPRAAPHTCGVRTQTRTWRQSCCLDTRERSALRCEAGRRGRHTPLCSSEQTMNEPETEITQTVWKLYFDSNTRIQTVWSMLLSWVLA